MSTPLPTTEEERLDRIFYAFAGITPGEGIGFHEADCIDDYLEKDDPIRQHWRAKDERQHWCKVLQAIEDMDSYNYAVYCFMDLAGLYFFFPVMLCTEMDSAVHCLHTGLTKKDPSHTFVQLVRLFTPAQLDCIEMCLRVKLAEQIESYCSPYVCAQCGGDHGIVPQSLQEVLLDSDEYQILLALDRADGLHVLA